MSNNYSRNLLALALPITAQQLLTSSLNLASSLLIGQLGETAVAAVGLSNQFFFLLVLLLFGVASGGALFTAQLWGVRDVTNIRKVVGLSLTLSLLGGLIFSLVAVFFPRWVLGIYTPDPAVVAAGAPYLRAVGVSYLFTAVTASFSSSLRSTGDVRMPLYVSLGSLSLGALLSFGLIFGNFGLPRLGVVGAGVATSVARLVEMTLLVTLTYTRRRPIAGTPRELFGYDLPFAKTVLQRALPVAFNEFLWALAISAYNIIYAHIGTEAVAAVNISTSIENLAFVVFLGITDATAILVGHRIGAGDEAEARDYARRSLRLAVISALGMGLLIFLFSGGILALYKVSPLVKDYARHILWMMAALQWLRVSNLVLFIGVFRAGGDTRYAFLLDTLSIWLVGVPLAYLGAFVLRLPIYWVYLMVMGEEFLKCLIALRRFLSGKWLTNVARTLEQDRGLPDA